MKRLLALFMCAAVMLAGASPALAATPVLRAHFIGIGQGDAIFVELPDQKTMLVDAGNPGDGEIVLQYVKNLGYNTIDYVVASHPHADHIGGMADVIRGIDVNAVYMPDITTDTQTFIDVLNAVKSKGVRIARAKAGTSIASTDKALKMDFVAPSKTYDELNNNSAVLKIVYGDRALLLTGDAEALEEADIAADVKADVLKVGHHGSDSSTSAAFLKRVAPQYAVISAGQGNSYGHPAQATLDALKAAGTKVYRTDTDGTVIVSTDGKTVEISTAAAPVKPNAPGTAKPGTSSAATTLAENADQGQVVYWTPGGKSYHDTEDCVTLKRSKTIKSGTLDQAISAGKDDPCNVCAGG